MATMEGAHADEGYAKIAGAPKDGPVLTMMSKRLRALKKKYNKILQIEESKAHGKVINREQEEVLKTKIAVAVLIDEYEKLRQPLQVAVKEELVERERDLMNANLGRRGSEDESVENDKESETKEEVQKEVVNGNSNQVEVNLEHMANGFVNGVPEHSERQVPEPEAESQYQSDELRRDDDVASFTNDPQKESILRVYGEETSANAGLSEAQVADLLNLMYFARLFDVRSEGELPSFVWTKVHERSSCLSYDFVFDDATTPLTEGDLDALSLFGSLLTARPQNVTLSHKDALQQCIQHARLWLLNSDSQIHPELSISYTGLRERLNRILSSEYFTMTPELQTVTQQTAAAAASAASQYVSKILISEPMVGNHISEAEGFSVHETHQASFQHHYLDGESVATIPVSAGNELLPADSSIAVNTSYNASEHSSVTVDVPQHLIGQQEEDQMALSPGSASEQVEQLQQEVIQPLPPTRQRQQHNPPQNGGVPRGGGYQGARGSGRGYGYGMGGRGRGYANGRGNRGGRGYSYGRGGQFYDQGGYYPRNQYGGRSGRSGRGGFVNDHVNGEPTAAVTGQA
ncbi:hypothetical protein O6H91_16G003400 [Diphasiastrum complanatum]|uniref:Uncharacterized protein n=1 Tax=Diphasiastrum complanatum TaxID=34168 RepID=A0ACC2BAC5_DIPCM|nr:hypothetical protein O6H91_16G003400 [Diphasiastrum complanatum]